MKLHNNINWYIDIQSYIMNCKSKYNISKMARVFNVTFLPCKKNSVYRVQYVIIIGEFTDRSTHTTSETQVNSKYCNLF